MQNQIFESIFDFLQNNQILAQFNFCPSIEIELFERVCSDNVFPKSFEHFSNGLFLGFTEKFTDVLNNFK